MAREVAFFDEQGVDGGRGATMSGRRTGTSTAPSPTAAAGDRTTPGGRGFDVYKLLSRNGDLVGDDGQPTFGAGDDANDPSVQEYKARNRRHSNPQTQDISQKIGG